jgi:anhydro-N-acetylmuramic acid kinase
MRVIGLMSGTSHDAIDAAAADLNLVGDSPTLQARGLVNMAHAEASRHAPAAAALRADRELCDRLPGGHRTPARTSKRNRKAS